MGLTISRALIEAIREQARAAAPAECCGLLLGMHETDEVAHIVPAGNVAQDPRHHFEIDPAVLLAAHRAARSGGPDIVGHYHSHPAGEARPSPTDAAMASPSGCFWLIVGTDGALTAWRSGAANGLHGCFDPVEIIVPPQDGLAPAGTHGHLGRPSPA